MKTILLVTVLLLAGAVTMTSQISSRASVFQERQSELKSGFLKFDKGSEMKSPLSLHNEGMPSGVLIVGGLALSAVPFLAPNARMGGYVLSGLGGALLIAGIVALVNNASDE